MDDQRRNQESRPQTSGDPVMRPQEPLTGGQTPTGTGASQDPLMNRMKSTSMQPEAPGMHKETEGTVKSAASDAMEQAKSTAGKTAANVRSMLQERLDTGYHKAEERLSSAVSDMRRVADTLEQQGQPGASKIVNSATRQGERLTSYMEHKSAEDLLADANRYAREHVWMVVAGGMLLGVVAARFLKASGAETATQPQSQPETSYARAA